MAQKYQGSYPNATVTVFQAQPEPLAISTIERASNVVTATVPDESGFLGGELVTIAGVTDASFNGTFTIVSVEPTTFSYAQAGVDATSSGGTADSALRIATIYDDDNGTPKANPFTASSEGYWFFYTANGRVDVRFSGGGIPVPFTMGDYLLHDPDDERRIDVTKPPYNAIGEDVAHDTEAIQDALDAGDVEFPDGYTWTVTGLFVPSNRRIWGTWGSTIKLADETDSPVFTCSDTENIVFDGVRIDGNKANQTGTTTAGIFVQGAKHIKIKYCLIENTKIESVLISKNENSGEFPNDVDVSHNSSVNPSYAVGFRQHYAVTGGYNIRIAHNHAHSDDGFAAFMVDLEPNNPLNPIEDVTITGNTGRIVGGVACVSNYGQIIKRITVSSNTVLGAGAGRGNAYIIRGCQVVTFSGNVSDITGLNALEVSDSVSVNINGNALRGYGIDQSPGQTDGIQVTSSIGVVIDGNMIASSEPGAFGIRETDTSCITFVGRNRTDVAIANQIVLLSSPSMMLFPRWNRDGMPYGNWTWLAAEGGSAGIALEWTGTHAVLRPVGGATFEISGET